jgi:glycosyltransferase involved in cell wall biosynthesis
MPQVSFLMSAYNGAKHIREAIDSALAQTFQDFELVIVDDGSKDDTAAVVESVRDPRVRYHRRLENKGITFTRNECLSRAQGEFVAILDQDDVARPDRLEKQVAFLRAHPSVAVAASVVRLIDTEGRVLAARSGQPIREDEGLARLYFENFVANPSTLMRRSAVPAGGYDPLLPPSEDYWFWYEIAERGKIVVMPEALTDYRIHGSSASHVFQAAQVKNSDIVIRRMLERAFQGSTLAPEWVDLHLELFFRPKEAWRENRFGEAREWFARLKAQMESKKLAPPRALDRLFAEQWAVLCFRRRSIGSLPLWPGATRMGIQHGLKRIAARAL